MHFPCRGDHDAVDALQEFIPAWTGELVSLVQGTKAVSSECKRLSIDLLLTQALVRKPGPGPVTQDVCTNSGSPSKFFRASSEQQGRIRASRTQVCNQTLVRGQVEGQCTSVLCFNEGNDNQGRVLGNAANSSKRILGGLEAHHKAWSCRMSVGRLIRVTDVIVVGNVI